MILKINDKIIAYLLVTALMVITFICAIAISKGYYAEWAWVVLLALNIGALVVLSGS